MKSKIVIFIILVILAILIISCSSKPEKEPDITGIIYSKNQQSILVVEGINLHNSYDEWFKEGKMAINFTVNNKTAINQGKQKLNFNDLEEGQMVKVWSAGPLAESYPMQGTAKKIIIID